MEPQVQQVTEKIREFHPEIAQNNVDLSVTWTRPATAMPSSSARPEKQWALIWTRKMPMIAWRGKNALIWRCR